MPRTWPAIAAALALALAAFPRPAAGEGENAPVRVALSPREIPPESWTDIAKNANDDSVGFLVWPLALKGYPGNVPAGFDFLYDGSPGCAPTRDPAALASLRVLLRERGASGQRELCQWKGSGELLPIPRLPPVAGGAMPFLLFGPVSVEGLPPAALLLMNGGANGVPGGLRVVPRTCMAGEAELAGRRILVGFLDRDLDGDWKKPCAGKALDGDRFLADEDGDGIFRIASAGPESPTLNAFVRAAGRFWHVSFEGETLLLTPAQPPAMRFRTGCRGGSCAVRGWSNAAGNVSLELDVEGSGSVPEGDFRLYSYEWKKDAWSVRTYTPGGLNAWVAEKKRGCPATKWTIEPSPDGGVRDVPLGGAVRCELRWKRVPEGASFSYRFLDRAGIDLQLRGPRGTILPAVVIRDPDGVEVFRSRDWDG
jgi:hypothetical protein